MKHRPPFTSDTQIIAKLEQSYGLHVKNLRFLPVGEDSWCYSAETHEGHHFVKIARQELYLPSIMIPTLLQNTFSYTFINPTRPNQEGHLWDSLASHVFVLYPYIAGTTLMECELSHAQWQEVGRIIATLHRTRPEADIQQIINREDFVPGGADGARKVVAHALHARLDGIAGELARFIQEKASEMLAIIARAEELGRIVREQQPEIVLCHSDPNKANILITPEKRIILIDWDGVMLAPRERDLMFFTGNEHEPFMDGYNEQEKYQPNLSTIAYYKYEWVVQEFHDYGTRIFFKQTGEPEKQHALQEFYQLFTPDDVIHAAYAADKVS